MPYQLARRCPPLSGLIIDEQLIKAGRQLVVADVEVEVAGDNKQPPPPPVPQLGTSRPLSVFQQAWTTRSAFIRSSTEDSASATDVLHREGSFVGWLVTTKRLLDCQRTSRRIRRTRDEDYLLSASSSPHRCSGLYRVSAPRWPGKEAARKNGLAELLLDPEINGAPFCSSSSSFSV